MVDQLKNKKGGSQKLRHDSDEYIGPKLQILLKKITKFFSFLHYHYQINIIIHFTWFIFSHTFTCKQKQKPRDLFTYLGTRDEMKVLIHASKYSWVFDSNNGLGPFAFDIAFAFHRLTGRDRNWQPTTENVLGRRVNTPRKNFQPFITSYMFYEK